MAHPFDRFDEIVLGDTEFIHRTGELYEPVCLAFKELRSGRSGALWCDELGSAPPHARGPSTLFVGFTAAEPEFYFSVFGSFDMAFLDLRVEGIHQTNIAYRRDDPKREKPPRSLISFLRANNISDGDETIKAAMRDRVLKGWPFNCKERRLVLKYCMSDVELLEKLLWVLLPGIRNFDQALRRGEYVKLTAEIFYHGIPADPWASGLLRRHEIRKAVRLRAVSNTDLTHGLYTGPTLTQAQVDEFLVRHDLKDDWRRTKTGKLGSSYKDFERLEEQRPKQFKGLADTHKTIRQLHEMQLFAGRDTRYRAQIWAFSTITSRAAPDGAEYPFTVPSWCRFTMMPTAAKVLWYLDFGSMEFGVAGGLSRDPAMIADYAKEPYLVVPILAGLLPPDATKHTHGELRDRWKPMILAVQYGGGADLLQRRLGIPRGQAQRIVDLHHERYSTYWDWSDRRLQRAFDDGELVARDGWRCGVNSRTSIFTARNWLVQTNSQAIFRYAGLMMRRVELKLVAIVHDAVLGESGSDRAKRDAALATECLQRASRRFLYGLTLKVDPKYIWPGDRFTDGRGERVWQFVEQTLHELEEGMMA